MGKKSINIVWIKRDIRTIDHEAFHVAESMELPYIPIYIFDSELIKYPDTSDRHLQFIFDSIIDAFIYLGTGSFPQAVNPYAQGMRVNPCAQGMRVCASSDRAVGI